MPELGAIYLEDAFRSLRGIKRQADAAMQQLSDEQFFTLLDADSNSVAIIVKHMAGNMRSRFSDFLTTDGESLIATATRSSSCLLMPRARKSW